MCTRKPDRWKKILVPLYWDLAMSTQILSCSQATDGSIGAQVQGWGKKNPLLATECMPGGSWLVPSEHKGFQVGPPCPSLIKGTE